MESVDLRASPQRSCILVILLSTTQADSWAVFESNDIKGVGGDSQGQSGCAATLVSDPWSKVGIAYTICNRIHIG